MKKPRKKTEKRQNEVLQICSFFLERIGSIDRASEECFVTAKRRRRASTGRVRRRLSSRNPNMYRWGGRDGLEKTDVLSTARRFDFFVNLFFLKKHVHLIIRREGGGGNGYICQAGNVGPQDN